MRARFIATGALLLLGTIGFAPTASAEERGDRHDLVRDGRRFEERREAERREAERREQWRREQREREEREWRERERREHERPVWYWGWGWR
jgi:hypothetical protein